MKRIAKWDKFVFKRLIKYLIQLLIRSFGWSYWRHVVAIGRNWLSGELQRHCSDRRRRLLYVCRQWMTVSGRVTDGLSHCRSISVVVVCGWRCWQWGHCLCKMATSLGRVRRYHILLLLSNVRLTQVWSDVNSRMTIIPIEFRIWRTAQIQRLRYRLNWRQVRGRHMMVTAVYAVPHRTTASHSSLYRDNNYYILIMTFRVIGKYISFRNQRSIDYSFKLCLYSLLKY